MANKSDVCFKTEQLLEREGIKWNVLEIPLAKIDWNKSEKNAGRCGRGVDESLAEEYGIQMLDGDRFPMTCVARDGGKYVIVMGNHRLRGARDAGIKSVFAYVIALEHEAEYRVLAFASNRKEGRREDKTRAIAFATNMVFETGCKPEEAARQASVSVDTVKRHIKAAKIRQHCDSLGLTTQSLSQEHMMQLGKMLHSDNVLRESVKTATVGPMSAKQLGEIIKDVKKNRTEVKQLARLEDIIEQVKSECPQKRAGITMGVQAKFHRAFNTLASFVNGNGEVISGISYNRTSNEFNAKKKEWKSLRQALNNVFK